MLPASPPPSPSCSSASSTTPLRLRLPRSFITSFHLQLNVKRGSSAPPQASFCLRREAARDAGTREGLVGVRGGGGVNWIFDTCHFHSAAPCSLATHKDFSCHSLACYHEWARGLRNPITGCVSDSRHYGCCGHVAGIRKDLLISSSSSSSSSSPFSLALTLFFLILIRGRSRTFRLRHLRVSDRVSFCG